MALIDFGTAELNDGDTIYQAFDKINNIIGYGSTTSPTNTIVGIGAGAIMDMAYNNVMLGNLAGALNVSGGSNTFVGTNAGTNTTVSNNTFLGANSGYVNTTGYSNTACGVNSLYLNTTGNSNSAFGSTAGYANTTGVSNSFFGFGSSYNNTTGYSNTSIGFKSSYLNTTGIQNTFSGAVSGYNNTTGSNNTAFGYQSLYNNTTGSSNTAIGHLALTGSSGITNATGLGYNATVTASNQVQLGDSATTTYVYGTVQNRSDLRDKAEVRNTVLGLDFISKLRPVDYKWDMREDYREEFPIKPNNDATEEEFIAYEESVKEWMENSNLSNLTHDGANVRSRFHHGLIAQEVKSVMDEIGVDFGGFQDHTLSGGEDVLSIGYDELIAPMIRAIQELKAEIELLKIQA